MKYITPEIFESNDFYTPLESLKKDLEDIEAGKCKCVNSWCGTLNDDGARCCEKIALYILRYYSNYWDIIAKKQIKHKYIYVKAYCEAHKPRGCRKVTPKEIFFIKIC